MSKLFKKTAMSFLLAISLNAADALEGKKNVLHKAVAENKLDLVKSMLNNSAQVNALDEENYTPLSIACAVGNMDMIKLLLSYNASIDVPECVGASHPMYLAIVFDNDHVIKNFIESGYINVNYDINEAGSIMRYAIVANNLELIKYLIEKGVSIYSYIEGSSLIEFHLKKYPVIDFGYVRDLPEYYLRFCKLQTQYVQDFFKISQYFLENGCNIRSDMKYLVDRGLSYILFDRLNISRLSQFALNIVMYKQEWAADLFKELLCEANARDEFGMSATMWASCRGNFAVVKAILELADAKKSVDLSLTNNEGNSALSLAKKYKRNEIVELLATYLSEHKAAIDESLQLMNPLKNMIFDYTFG